MIDELIDYFTAVWMTVEGFVAFAFALIVFSLVVWVCINVPIVLFVVLALISAYTFHKSVTRNLTKLKNEREQLRELQARIDSRDGNE